MRRGKADVTCTILFGPSFPFHLLTFSPGYIHVILIFYQKVCKGCKPVREYIRLFDVTEKTSLRKHKTGRQCYKCGHDLVDTIVHFGERGTLKSPLNWPKAIKAAEKCDLILCLGSSLKVT